MRRGRYVVNKNYVLCLPFGCHEIYLNLYDLVDRVMDLMFDRILTRTEIIVTKGGVSEEQEYEGITLVDRARIWLLDQGVNYLIYGVNELNQKVVRYSSLASFEFPKIDRVYSWKRHEHNFVLKNIVIRGDKIFLTEECTGCSKTNYKELHSNWEVICFDKLGLMIDTGKNTYNYKVAV